MGNKLRGFRDREENGVGATHQRCRHDSDGSNRMLIDVEQRRQEAQ
jgi:hypothetical protein